MDISEEYLDLRPSHKDYKQTVRVAWSSITDALLITHIGTTAFTVYCVLKGHTNSCTGKCYPSYKRIKELTGIGGNKTVSTALKALVNHRLIKIVKIPCRYKDGRLTGRYKNSYIVY